MAEADLYRFFFPTSSTSDPDLEMMRSYSARDGLGRRRRRRSTTKKKPSDSTFNGSKRRIVVGRRWSLIGSLKSFSSSRVPIGSFEAVTESARFLCRFVSASSSVSMLSQLSKQLGFNAESTQHAFRRKSGSIGWFGSFPWISVLAVGFVVARFLC